LSRLRGIFGKQPAATAPKGDREVELEHALELKQAWHQRGLLLRGGLASPEVRDKIAGVEDHLLGGRVYAVDAKKGARTLQTPAQVELHARLLERELANFLPGDKHAEVRKMLARALQRVRGKALYTRSGLHGLGDLLEDELIASTIARTPAETERLAVALEAVRSAATTQSLHPVGLAGTPPLEVQYAIRRDPGLGALIEQARAEGVEIHFRRAERTPRDVLEAIDRIAVLTQENFVQTWLPALVRDGARPNLTLSARGLARARERGVLGEGASEAELRAQLERDVTTIQHASRHMMGFVTSRTSIRHAGLDERLEQALDPLRVDHAIARMMFDNADDNTHEAQGLMRKMMLIAPAAQGLEMLDLGSVAKMVAGTADDLMNVYIENKSLTGRGFSKQEVRKRYVAQGAVLAAATYGLKQVEPLLDSGHAATAGALFGLSAVALSLTSTLQSIAMYKNAYDALLREGKIAGKLGPLAGDPRFQATLKALDRTRALLRPDGKAALLEEVRKHLDGLGEAIAPAEKAGILEELGRIDLAKIDAQVRSPSSMKRWKAAVAQDFSNPTQLGILIGSSLAPALGAVAAKTGLMHNGFVNVGIGAAESLVGGVTVMAARRLDQWKQQRALQQKLDALPPAAQ
jgi:hypothetical protein